MTNSVRCGQISNRSCLSSIKVSFVIHGHEIFWNPLTCPFRLHTILHEDDRDSGWKPSSDDNGRIFVNARGWTCSNMQDTELTYDEAEQFLRFVDKYVVRAVGVHFLSHWSKLHRSKTILEKVAASDIAYTILVYKNSKEVWEEKAKVLKEVQNTIVDFLKDIDEDEYSQKK